MRFTFNSQFFYIFFNEDDYQLWYDMFKFLQVIKVTIYKLVFNVLYECHKLSTINILKVSN